MALTLGISHTKVGVGGPQETPDHESMSPCSPMPSSIGHRPPDATVSYMYTQRDPVLAVNRYHDFPALLNLPRDKVMPQIVTRVVYSGTSSSGVDYDGRAQSPNTSLQPPVIFWSARSRECSVSLQDALSDKCLLVNPDDVVLNYGPTFATIRLQVPGYISRKAQMIQGCRICLRTYIDRKHWKPLTKSRLLRAVARVIKRIFEGLARQEQDTAYVSRMPFNWAVGLKSDIDKVAFEDMYIASLHNVSQGVWQPHIFLRPNYTSYLHRSPNSPIMRIIETPDRVPGKMVRQDLFSSSDNLSKALSARRQSSGLKSILSPSTPLQALERDPGRISDVSLTELLSYWKIFGIIDLTNQIEIIEPENPSRGGFSEVFKGWYGRTEVAIKAPHLAGLKKECKSFLRLCKRLAREIRVWSGLRHPNVVGFWGVYMTYPGTRPGMVMPWYKHGNAAQYLLTKSFSICDKFTLFYEVACGLAYLHTRSPLIVHGDLKATNVLIDNNGHAVLCDFGVSRIVEEVMEATGCTTSGGAEGSLRWSAPEVVLSDAPTRLIPASDVWSFGCTGYEIFSGKLPYHRLRSPGPIMKQIMEGVPPTWPESDCHDIIAQRGNNTTYGGEHVPKFIVQFINSRWQLNPKKRGEMHEILDEMQSLMHFLARNEAK